MTLSKSKKILVPIAASIAAVATVGSVYASARVFDGSRQVTPSSAPHHVVKPQGGGAEQELEDALVSEHIEIDSYAPPPRKDRGEKLDQNPISSTDAIQHAWDSAPSILNGATVASTSLVTLTTSDYGSEATPTPGGSPVITPKYQAAPAWAVVFSNAQIPAGGPVPTGGQPTPPAYESMSVVVFIDAYTGAQMVLTSVDLTS
jgi:hypothetical protein